MDDRVAYAVVVGQLIQQLRQRTSQVDLAKRAGLSQSSLSRFEKGQTMPDVFEMHRLAKALGRTSSEFMILVERSFQRTEDVAKKAVNADALSGVAAAVLGALSVVAVTAIIEELSKAAKKAGR
jgi:transcriptional regulator with XRE-family HTH domain